MVLLITLPWRSFGACALSFDFDCSDSFEAFLLDFTGEPFLRGDFRDSESVDALALLAALPCDVEEFSESEELESDPEEDEELEEEDELFDEDVVSELVAACK